MKKTWAIRSVICLSVFLLTGCQSASEKETSEIAGIVENFFKSDYDYEETTTYYDVDGRIRIMQVIEGQLFQDPYKEHLRVTPYSRTIKGTSSDLYRTGKWNFITAYVPTDNGWVKQMQQRAHPHGFGRDLTFSSGKQDTNDPNLEIYSAEYTVDDGKSYKLNEDLSAVISQKYYVDKDKKILVRIETDLTEMNKKHAMIVDMVENGSTMKQAKEKVAKMNDITQTVVLDIYNLGNATDFDLPKGTG